MEDFLFCSRHQITPEQTLLAAEAGITLHQGIDLDAFSPNYELIKLIRIQGEFDGVIVVHPALALKLCSVYQIGVFENANRAAEGTPPSFQAVGLEIYDLIPRDSAWEHTAHYQMTKYI